MRWRARRGRAPGLPAIACALLVAAGCAGSSGPPAATQPAVAAATSPATVAPAAPPGTAPHATPAPESEPAATAPPPAAAGSGRDRPAICVEGAGCLGRPELVGAFDATLVPEASGLAASRRNPGVLWLLDDRPGTNQVWAVGRRGDMLGAVTVAGLDARDTEALVVGACGPGDPTWCVYVGDIGDNHRRREDIRVHRFPEPDLSGGVPATPVAAEAVRLSYPDGPHDAEALLVGADGALLVVTKAPFDPATGQTGQARLFVADSFADGVLADHGPVALPPPAVPLHSQFVGSVVTGGDVRDGLVLLRTYDQVLLYVAPDAAAPLETFPAWPVYEVPGALEPQSEAIAWAADGCGYYTVGEQVGDVWYVRCLP